MRPEVESAAETPTVTSQRRPIPPGRQPVINGDVVRVPLTQGQIAILDFADLDLVAGRLWCATKVGTECGFYAVSWAGAAARPRSNVEMHRLIMGHPDTFVDHVNGNGLDNRRTNLRLCTQSENVRNRIARKPANASSQYLGVSLHGTTGKWQSAVRPGPGQKRCHLGWFATDHDAAIARDEFIRAHCPSEFWTFNFPLPGERGINREDVPA